MWGPRRKAVGLGLGKRIRGAHAWPLSDGQFCAYPLRRRVGSPGWAQTPGPGVQRLGSGGTERPGAGAPVGRGRGVAPWGLPLGAPGRLRARAQVRGTRRQLTCGAPGGTRSAEARRAGGRASAARPTWASCVHCAGPTGSGVRTRPGGSAGAGPRAGRRGNKPPRSWPAGAHWLQTEGPPRGRAAGRGGGGASRRVAGAPGGFRSSAPSPRARSPPGGLSLRVSEWQRHCSWRCANRS